MPGNVISRRALLGRLLAGPIAARAAFPGPPVLRVLILSQLEPDCLAGIRFGAREAALTAQLLGRDVQLVPPGGETTGALGGLAAGAAARGLPRDLPILLVQDGTSERSASGDAGRAPDTCAFRVRLSARERTALLADWRASRRDAAPDGVELVEWHRALVRYGAGELNERFVAATGKPLTAAGWVGWFAVKVLVESALRYAALPGCEALATGRFDGHKGRALTFDRRTRMLRQPLYVVDGERVLAELPGEVRS